MGLYTRHSSLEPESILLFSKLFGKWVSGQAWNDSAFYLGGALSLK